MKIGYTVIPNDASLAMGERIGFNCAELFGIDFLRITDDEIKEIVERCARHNLTITSLQCGSSHMHSDPVVRRREQAEFMRAIELTRKFGTDILMTNAETDLTDTIAGNLKTYKTVFGEYARAAEAAGVRIAIENCAHLVTDPIRFGNLAVTPELWDAMFNEVPSDVIGLEFDPSHLVWQQIDIPQAIKMFRKKIFSFHAKDTEILRENRALVGVVAGKSTDSALGGPWWRHRIPGLGDIDWKETFRALYDIHYDGPIIIEHEDECFTGDREEAGFTLGYKFLSPFLT